MKFYEYLKKKNLTLRDLSSQCDIPYATLHNNIEKPAAMKAVNLRKISHYLGLTMEELLDMMMDTEESLKDILLEQKEIKLSGNIYHVTQVKFAYNTNRIEGSKLSEDETRFIFETNTLLEGENSHNVDDIMETANHFYLFDIMLDEVELRLTEDMIKKYHGLLKNGTEDSRKKWFNVGDYKKLPNEVGGKETIAPQNVSNEMKKLLKWYYDLPVINFQEIIDFHYRFERIHPFQDGNGRIGRLIMFRECLKNNIMPFIIEDTYKAFYYRGLAEFDKERGWLIDTCLSMQDQYRTLVNKLLPDYESKEKR